MILDNNYHNDLQTLLNKLDNHFYKINLRKKVSYAILKAVKLI